MSLLLLSYLLIYNRTQRKKLFHNCSFDHFYITQSDKKKVFLISDSETGLSKTISFSTVKDGKMDELFVLTLFCLICFIG